MRCQETHELIHGYVDGELDLVKSLEIEEHLRECTACAYTYEQIRSLRSPLGQDGLRFQPPARLEKHLRSALRRESERAPIAQTLRWRWLAVGTALIAVVTVIWAVAAFLARRSPSDLLAQEIVSSHVRSLMADHLTDVPSSDRHAVKPWFNGKLDFSPPVKDLSQQGFSLDGGRLDYISNRPVAALVYKRGQHSINLFVWPTTERTDSRKALVSQGYNLISWSNGGMAYWVVSDLNLTELNQFVQLLHEENQARLSDLRSAWSVAPLPRPVPINAGDD